MNTVAARSTVISAEGWQYTTLGHVAQVKGGKRLPKGEGFADTVTSFPYIRVTDFANFSIDTSDLRYLKPETQVAIEHYTISKSDVYISIAGSIGITGMIPARLDGANLTENAAKLVLNEDLIDARFLMYYLASEVAQTEIRGQTVKNAQPKLALARIASLEIPLPPLPEQRKIAAVLGLVQRTIEQQERLVALTTELKKALVHKLFTEGLRSEPQKETEIGPVPESWEVQTIQSLVDEGVLDKPMDGNHGSIHPKSEDYTDSGIPFVMASDLSDGTIDFSSCAYLRKEQADRLQKGFARPGDVLISHKATIGVTAIVPSVEHYVMLTPQVTYYRSLQPTRLQNRFLKCFFDSEGFQRAFAAVARDGSTRSYIGITKQRSLLVAYPRIEEQRQISEILHTVEQKILLAKNRQRVLSELFRTMLHELMTAQIRVNDLDLDGSMNV